MSSDQGPAGPERSLGTAAATALVVGNMVGVGILLTPRLVANALPDLGPYLGLWVLGGLIAAAGAAVYAELGARYPEAGGDVAFQEAAFGRGFGLGSGVLMFAAAFAASVAAIAVAIGTWQVPMLLGLEAPAAGVMPKAVGIGVIALLTGINLLGLRVGAAVQVVTTMTPVVALVGLAIWGLVSGVDTAVPVDAVEPSGPDDVVGAFSGVYFAFAGWPAVVYLAGQVQDPGRTLPRAMLGGTALVTGLYVLLNLAFVRVLGMGGVQQAYEAGSALVAAVVGPEAGWAMAAVVFLALLASVNATILGGAHVAVALARRGGLPARFGVHDARDVPRAALLLQAGVAVVLVSSGTFDQIVEASVLAMLAIGSLTVLSLVALRRRRAEGEPAYRATAWPLSPALYLLVSGTVLVLGIWDGFTGESGRGVLVSLVVLAGSIAFFTARERRSAG